MKFYEVLDAIVDDGTEAARLDYTKPNDKLKLEGSLLGFSECRGKTPVEIAVLLAQAGLRQQEAFHDRAPDYWYWRCRHAEIEWVANVVSALLMLEGLPIITNVTARGLEKALDIVGVKQLNGWRRTMALDDPFH